MAFPSIGVLDSFTRANESPIASPWSGPIFAGEQQLALASNQLAVIAAQTEGNSFYNSNFGPDLETYCTLTSAMAANTRVIFYFRSTTGASVSGYRVQFRNLAGDHLVMIDRMDANAVTQLGANIDPADTFAATDKFGVSMSGSTISAYYYRTSTDWVLLGTRSDSTYASTGKVGVSLVGAAVTVDDFAAGTVSAAGLGDDPAFGFSGRGAGW